MNQSGTIKSVEPKYAIPGAEIAIEIDGFSANMRGGNGVFGGEKCRIVAASSSRVLAVVPNISHGAYFRSI